MRTRGEGVKIFKNFSTLYLEAPLLDLIRDNLTIVRLADDNIAGLHSFPTESEAVLPVVTPEAEPCVIFAGLEPVRIAADMQSADGDTLHRDRHLQFCSEVSFL